MNKKHNKDYKTGMGRRIKQRRKEFEMTQEEPAERLGISVRHMSEAERGLSGLSIENLIRLSELFGVSLDYYIRGETVINRWQLLLPQLETVPPDKADDLYGLILTGIRIAEK